MVFCKRAPSMFSTSAMIRAATPADAAAISVIYNPYVLKTTACFEDAAVSAAEMAERISGVLQQGLPWLVAELGTEVVGYCYATPWKARAGYRFSVEVTVYLAPHAQGRGLGFALYQQLFLQLKLAGYHAALGGIVQPNAASVALHAKCCMTQVALLPEVGFKHGQWHSIGYWQLLLDEFQPA